MMPKKCLCGDDDNVKSMMNIIANCFLQGPSRTFGGFGQKVKGKFSGTAMLLPEKCGDG